MINSTDIFLFFPSYILYLYLTIYDLNMILKWEKIIFHNPIYSCTITHYLRTIYLIISFVFEWTNIFFVCQWIKMKNSITFNFHSNENRKIKNKNSFRNFIKQTFFWGGVFIHFFIVYRFANSRDFLLGFLFDWFIIRLFGKSIQFTKKKFLE